MRGGCNENGSHVSGSRFLDTCYRADEFSWRYDTYVSDFLFPNSRIRHSRLYALVRTNLHIVVLGIYDYFLQWFYVLVIFQNVHLVVQGQTTNKKVSRWLSIGSPFFI